MKIYILIADWTELKVPSLLSLLVTLNKKTGLSSNHELLVFHHRLEEVLISGCNQQGLHGSGLSLGHVFNLIYLLLELVFTKSLVQE